MQSHGYFVDRVTKTPYTILDKQCKWVNIFNSPNPISALLSARNRGKTEIVVLAGICYRLYLDPTETFHIITRRSERSEHLTQTIYAMLNKIGIATIGTPLRFKVAGATKIEPSVSCSFIGSTNLRGLHCDYILFDDPMSNEDRWSKAGQKTANETFIEAQNVAKKVIVISQLISMTDFVYTRLYSGDPEVDLYTSWHGDLPEIEESAESIKARLGDTNSWLLNYEGVMPKNYDMPFADILLCDEEIGDAICVIDPSKKSGEESNYTAVTVLWRTTAGFLAALGFQWKKSPDKCLKELVSVCSLASHTYYENNATGTLLQYILQDQGISSSGFASTTNKHQRIIRYAMDAKNGIVRLHTKSHVGYITDIKRWSVTAEHDDAIDSLVMALNLYYGKKN